MKVHGRRYMESLPQGRPLGEGRTGRPNPTPGSVNPWYIGIILPFPCIQLPGKLELPDSAGIARNPAWEA